MVMVVKITPPMLKRAQKKSESTGQINERSFMKGKGNLTGFLGEEIFLKAFPHSEVVDDYSIDFKINNMLIDVKSKIQRVEKDPIESGYEASVPTYAKHSKTTPKNGVFVFTRIFYDKEKDTYPYGWILGYMDMEEYFDSARFLKKGSMDFSNGFKARDSAFNMLYKDLHHIDLFKELIK